MTTKRVRHNSHRDVRYYSDGNHFVRCFVSPTATMRDAAWENADFEKLSKVDGMWRPSDTARLDIEYDGDWVECEGPGQPTPDWWQRHRPERRKANR